MPNSIEWSKSENDDKSDCYFDVIRFLAKWKWNSDHHFNDGWQYEKDSPDRRSSHRYTKTHADAYAQLSIFTFDLIRFFSIRTSSHSGDFFVWCNLTIKSLFYFSEIRLSIGVRKEKKKFLHFLDLLWSCTCSIPHDEHFQAISTEQRVCFLCKKVQVIFL